jgi:hypothetical protein
MRTTAVAHLGIACLRRTTARLLVLAAAGRQAPTSGRPQIIYYFGMIGRLTLNRMDMFGLLAVGVTTFFFLGAALEAGSLYASVRPMSAGGLVLGCSGWFIATFGPIALAVVLWRWAKGLRKAWTLHVLMLPLALATLKLGGSLMLFGIGTPDFDATNGGPVIQAIALLLLAVIGYYAAVLYTAFKRWSAAANGS